MLTAMQRNANTGFQSRAHVQLGLVTSGARAAGSGEKTDPLVQFEAVRLHSCFGRCSEHAIVGADPSCTLANPNGSDRAPRCR